MPGLNRTEHAAMNNCLCHKNQLGKGCPLCGHRVQILLTVEKGVVVHQQLLRPDEMAMSLVCFTELAIRAGWTVIPPVSPGEEPV